MQAAAIIEPLAFYARIGAALFPIPAGSKDPTGIIQSFARDHSADPTQWTAWRTNNPGCNFGLVAGPSKVIIVDTDAKDDRNAAWAARCALFAEWGVPATAMPHVQSARGGWHDIFAVPDGVDATTLRQPDAIKKIINVRAGNGYVVTAGSFYDGTAKGEASGHYILISDAPPHVAPDALIKHCTRAERVAAPGVVGTRDKNDVLNLLKWLNDRGLFSAYEDWFSVGMALKLEFGDAGLDLWRTTHDDTVTAEIEDTKWRSFASEPTANSVTLATWIQRAKKDGWRGGIGLSTQAMFGETVAKMAQNAGAQLQTTPGAMPMLGREAKHGEVAAIYLAEFLAANIDAPTRPQMSDYPQLPETFCEHPLYQALRDCIDRVFALAESKKLYVPEKVIEPLAVLLKIDANTFQAVERKFHNLGLKLPTNKITTRVASIDNEVNNSFKAHDNWVRNTKTGKIDGRISDNIAYFLEFIRCEIRFNGWIERVEVKGFRWPEWTHLSDGMLSQLYMRAHGGDLEYDVAKEFLQDGVEAIAFENVFDPLLERIALLESEWDKVPRLDTWLSSALGLPDEPYHRAVARNIIGGMVRRARKPGSKHDTMVVMIGSHRQGTGKSTLAGIIADLGQSTLKQIADSGAKNFTDSIKLGHESKELVLSLAGKLVAEIGEMAMHNNKTIEEIKSMLSKQHDEGRPAYGRNVINRGRRNIFFGTSNQDQPLSDPTGNRRFLPIDANRKIDLEWMAANICHLVGEAATLETAGESFALPSDIWEIAAQRQESARSMSDVEVMLENWFAVTPTTEFAYLMANDLAHLNNTCKWGHATGKRNSMLHKLGFRYEWARNNGERNRAWIRGGQGLTPADIGERGVRYLCGVDMQGNATVTIRSGFARGAIPPPPGPPPLPLPKT